MDRGIGTLRSPAISRSPVPPSSLASALGSRPETAGPASFVGVEHEYSVTRSGERVDFRRLIHDLRVPGRRLDPGDANAYRCPSGLAITCDDAEAEVVSPPVPVRPGFVADIDGWGTRGAGELRRLLPVDIGITGFSTHLSASMPSAMVGPVCALFAGTFAPALMLVLDRADSHGVFVRPRPGRVELCGEFALGARLGAAAVLVAGGTRACAAALGAAADGHRDVGLGLPPVLAVGVRPATGRLGLFVGRRLAFGFDLYAAGRRARLPLEGGGEVGAQVHLELAWEAARLALGDAAGPADLDAGDRMVAGSGPLGVETTDDGDGPGAAVPAVPASPRSPFGDILEARHRPGFDVLVAAATWDFTVFRLSAVRREAVACVPTPWLGPFLERLDAGHLDVVLTAFLAAPVRGSVLLAHDQTREPALWDEAVIGPDLLPYEQTPIDVGESPPTPLARPGPPVVAPLPPEPPEPLAPEPPAPEPPAPEPPAPDSPFPERILDPSADSPPPSPGVRDRHPRVLAALLILLLVGTAAALAALLAGRGSSGVDVVTSPSAPSTAVEEPPATRRPETTVAPEPSPPAEPSPTAGPTTPPTVGARPTVASTAVPTPTRPEVTVPPPTPTVPTTTTAPSTTVAVDPPTDILAAVVVTPLGCGFQPPSITVTVGSTVRFRNDTGGDITITIDETTISLEAGGSSGANPLDTPGDYGVTCAPVDGSTGGMTITVTSG